MKTGTRSGVQHSSSASNLRITCSHLQVLFQPDVQTSFSTPTWEMDGSDLVPGHGESRAWPSRTRSFILSPPVGKEGGKEYHQNHGASALKCMSMLYVRTGVEMDSVLLHVMHVGVVLPGCCDAGVSEYQVLIGVGGASSPKACPSVLLTRPDSVSRRFLLPVLPLINTHASYFSLCWMDNPT